MAVGGVDWSLLPNDMVELISKFLSFDPDFIRFRSVCSRWRSAAPNRPQLPWLIGLREDAEGNDEILSFFKLSFRRNHELKILPIPELPESSLFDRMACRGSSHGWTVLLDFAAPSIVLWNPVTKSKIQLPTLPLFNVGHGDLSKYARIGERRYASILIHPSAGVRFFKVKLSAIEEYFASQVVLSSDPAVSSYLWFWPSFLPQGLGIK